MERPPRFAIIAAFAALYLIWGSTYLGILFAIQSIPPFLMAGVRFFLAGIIMYAIARFRGAPRPDPTTWRDALIVGACLLLFGNGGVTVAEKWVPTGLAALLVATVPIYIALLGWITGTAPRPSPMVWSGLIGGFIGVGLLVRGALTPSSDFSPDEHLALGMAILLFGSLVWSAGSLYSRRARNAPSPFLAAGQQMLCGGALLILAGVAFGEYRGFDPRHITMPSAIAFVYLVLDRLPGRISRLHFSPTPLRSGEGGDVCLRQPDRGRLARHRLCWRDSDLAHGAGRGIDYWIGGGCHYGPTNVVQGRNRRRSRNARLRQVKPFKHRSWRYCEFA